MNIKEWITKSILVRAAHQDELRDLIKANRCTVCQNFFGGSEHRIGCFCGIIACRDCVTSVPFNTCVYDCGDSMKTRYCDKCRAKSCNLCNASLIDDDRKYVLFCMICTRVLCDDCHKKSHITSKYKTICYSCTN